jgi:hypothetical protein
MGMVTRRMLLDGMLLDGLLHASAPYWRAARWLRPERVWPKGCSLHCRQPNSGSSDSVTPEDPV